MSNLGIYRRFLRHTYEQLLAGNRMRLSELESARRRVAEEGDRDARLLILGCDIASDAERREQALWFIDHEPGTCLGQAGVLATGAEPLALERWRRAVHRHRDDLRVLENAAWYFELVEPAEGLQLIESYCDRFPEDREAWELLASYIDMATTGQQLHGREIRARGLTAGATAICRGRSTKGVGWILHAMRVHAAELGQPESLRLLETAERAIGANASDCVSETACGLIWLAAGDLERALQHLRSGAQCELESEPLATLADWLRPRYEEEVRTALALRRKRLEAVFADTRAVVE